MTTETLSKPTTPARVESRTKPPLYEFCRLPVPIEYPDSDGQPMAESDFQFEPLVYSIQALKFHFRDRPDVYVSGNILFYYEEGQPTEVVAPDVFVVIGAAKHKRRFYKLWEEPKAPDFVLEITSRWTRSKDQGTKFGLYQFLGVTEYFCYGPTGDYLDPPLVGYRLKEGRYVSIPPKEVTPTSIVVSSEIVGLDLRAEGSEFRFVAPVASSELRGLAEAEVRIRELEAQLATMRTQE